MRQNATKQRNSTTTNSTASSSLASSSMISTTSQTKGEGLYIDDDDDGSGNLFQLFHDQEEHQNEEHPSPISYDDLKKQVPQKIQAIIDHISEKLQCLEGWKGIFVQYIMKILKEVRVSSSNLESPMDISYYVKVKKLIHKDTSATRYINGIVFRQNVMNQQMRMQLSNPQILMISSLEVQDLTFEQLMKDEKRIIKHIVDHILRLGPDIILVEKSGNMQIIDQLFAKNIVIVNKMKTQLLKQIQKATGAKFIKSTQNLEQHDPRRVIGTCQRIYFQIFEDLDSSYDRQQIQGDKTLMFIEGNPNPIGASIVISGPQKKDLESLKQIFIGVLRLARHLYLEKALIHSNNQIIHSLQARMNKEILNYWYNLPVVHHGEIERFLDEKMEMSDFLNRDKLFYTKINYVSANVDFFDDINRIDQIQQYIKAGYSQYFNNDKISFFAQMCSEPNVKEINYYSEEDVPLGGYIMLKVENLMTQCKGCQRPKYNHVSIYYNQNSFIRISVQQRILISEESTSPNVGLKRDSSQEVDDDQIDDRSSYQSSVRGDNSSIRGSIPLFSIEDRKSYNDREITLIQPMGTRASLGTEISMTDRQGGHQGHHQKGEDMNAQVDLKEIVKKHQNQQVTIEMFIQCNSCKEKLSVSQKLQRAHSQYSFLRFLQRMFRSYKKTKKEVTLEERQKLKDGNKDLDSNRKKSMFLCTHTETSRVFRYKEAHVKFFVDIYQRFKINVLKINDPKVMQAVVVQNNQLYAEISDELLNFVKNTSEHLINLVNAFALDAKEFSAVNAAVLDDDVSQMVEDIKSTKNEACLIIQDDPMALNQCFLTLRILGVLFFSRFLEIYQTMDVYFGISQSQPQKKQTILQRYTEFVSAQEKYNDLQSSSHSFQNEDVLENSDQGNLSSLHTHDEIILQDQSSIKDKGSLNISSVNISNQNPSLSNIPINNSKTSHKTSFHQANASNLINESASYVSNHHHNMDHQSIAQSLEYDFIHKWGNKTYIIEQEDYDSKYQIYERIPCIKQQPMNQVAWCLNSQQYGQDVRKQYGFIEFEKEHQAQKEEKKATNDWNSFIKSKLQPFETGSQVLNWEKDQTQYHITINLTRKRVERQLNYGGTSFLQSSGDFGPADQGNNQRSIDGGSFLVETRDRKQSTGRRNTGGNNMTYVPPVNIVPTHSSSVTSNHGSILNDGSIQNGSELAGQFNNSDVFSTPKISGISGQPTSSTQTTQIKEDQIIIYFAPQFDALRMGLKYPLKEYIKSLSSCAFFQSSGGQSKAKFQQSYDEMLVVKMLSEMEFQMFKKHAPDYFSYMLKCIIENKPHMLSKILGMYEIKKNYHSLEGSTQYFMVMENVFNGIPNSPHIVTYDLKGSENQRFVEKPEQGTVLLDTNFRIDRNAEPIPLQQDDYLLLDRSIQNDLKQFLLQREVVDYSLMIIIDYENYTIRMGIIDYIREYTFDKQTEHFIQIGLNWGQLPTIVPPQMYEQRFRQAILNQYFVPIVQEVMPNFKQ